MQRLCEFEFGLWVVGSLAGHYPLTDKIGIIKNTLVLGGVVDGPLGCNLGHSLVHFSQQEVSIDQVHPVDLPYVAVELVNRVPLHLEELVHPHQPNQTLWSFLLH